MTDELDPNKLIVEFINSNLDRFVETFPAALKGTKDSIRARFRRTYHNYLERILDRYSKSKSFFVRSEPLPIYNFFVPPDLTTFQRKLTKPGMAQLASIAHASIVTGSGGCGKSMLMRHLLITCIKQKRKTPVFLELRELNGAGGTIRQALLRKLNSNGLQGDNEYLELALRAGHFCALLDGFDELEARNRQSIAKEIQSIAENYPSNWIIVSSRPDTMLEGWEAFSQFTVEPFDLDRCIELVQKLPFDDPIKSKFVEALRSGLYKQHRSFLSNPLLLSIMLLTYSDIAHIPKKLSIFYSQAYESLFQKHDALKGGFQRERQTPLDIQDFGKAFAAFCVQSYDKREFSFSRTRALEYFNRAKTITGLDFDSAGILNDSIQAVCLMIEDGLDITFAHRSFQEYFVACFIRSAQPTSKGRLIRRFAPGVDSDAVMKLLFEMDPYSVEKYYVLPAIDKLRAQIGFKRKVGVTHFLKFINIMYREFQLEKNRENQQTITGTINDPKVYSAISFVYRNLAEPLGECIDSEKRDYAAVYDAFMREYGKRRVSCSSLRTTDTFVRMMMESGGYRSAEFLRHILQIGVRIRERHEQAQSSLEAILQSDDDHR